jgi:hypothetical protein
MFVRVYNKRLERLAKGEDSPGAHWVRVEVEAKDRGGDALARRFVDEGPGVIAGVLRHYLDFKETTGDSNRCRRPSCDWWLRFLSWAEKVQLGIGRAVRTLASAAGFVWRQCAPTLALLAASPSHGMAWLAEVLKHGEARWKASHIAMLAEHLSPPPTQPSGDGSGAWPVMCPELIPPVGEVGNRIGETEQRDEVLLYSPALRRHYRRGVALA